jgi:nicotinamidase-related amidase
VTAHLVVIDAQHVFADPGSGWYVPRFAEIVHPVRRLVAAFEPRVTFTRFVADPEPTGAWQAYYERWPFARVAATDPLYDLVEPFRDRPTLDFPTFGKWGPELAARVDDTIVLAGVSTDCCVLSTALPAADAGRRVLIASDACAGADDATHAEALHLMGLYAPLIEVRTSAELLGS